MKCRMESITIIVAFLRDKRDKSDKRTIIFLLIFF